VVCSDELEATPPVKNNSVIILQGELKGSTGKLIGIDGRDGIVKMDLGMDIKIQDMASLAVYTPNWCLPRIEVKVVSGDDVDRRGVVLELLGSACRVHLPAIGGMQGRTVVVCSDELEATPRVKNNSVIILKGERTGSTGKLLGIDRCDGIVKMDFNTDIKIEHMASLAVYIPV